MHLSRIIAASVLLAALGTARAQDPVPVDDESIFTSVESAIRAAPSLAAADIRVRAHDGAVTLTGTARTVQDIALAGRLAAGARGVSGVSNLLRVADRPARA